MEAPLLPPLGILGAYKMGTCNPVPGNNASLSAHLDFDRIIVGRGNFARSYSVCRQFSGDVGRIIPLFRWLRNETCYLRILANC